ncbi:MAG TPA: hypothetical protein VGI85_05065 [Chthoniobacterales bacterium]
MTVLESLIAMKLRSFTLASSLCLVAAIAIIVPICELAAAPPSPIGYIRFWNMLPAADGPMDLRRAGAGPTDPPLIGKSPSGRYNSYLEFSPGIYHLALSKSGEPEKPLKFVDLNLLANSYFTLLAYPTPQGPNLEVIKDTNDPKATSGTLTVRNFFPDVTAEVFNGASKIVGALTYGQSVVVPNLPLERLPLTIHTMRPENVPAESGAEADFKLTKRATLLIIPDAYGRFRPRVALDGKNL